MKIDILTPIQYGGPQKWGDDLVRALKNEGVEARNVHDFLGIIQRFFYTDADIIHTTLPLFFTLHKKPIILTVHGDYTREKDIWKYFYPLAIKKASKITVPSEFLKQEIGLGSAIVIPNGVFLEDFKKSSKCKKSRSIQLVTVTGFKFPDKAKGILELLKSLEQVKKETKKEFTFTVVGGGPYLKEIKEKAKQFNIPVNFIGFHPNPKEILEQSDIFLYYSFHDNMPITVLEAIASGLPVVSNDVGAINEVVGKEFTCRNTAQVTKKLLLLLKNPKNRKKACMILSKNVERFSLTKIVHDFLGLYKND